MTTAILKNEKRRDSNSTSSSDSSLENAASNGIIRRSNSANETKSTNPIDSNPLTQTFNRKHNTLPSRAKNKHLKKDKKEKKKLSRRLRSWWRTHILRKPKPKKPDNKSSNGVVRTDKLEPPKLSQRANNATKAINSNPATQNNGQVSKDETVKNLTLQSGLSSEQAITDPNKTNPQASFKDSNSPVETTDELNHAANNILVTKPDDQKSTNSEIPNLSENSEADAVSEETEVESIQSDDQNLINEDKSNLDVCSKSTSSNEVIKSPDLSDELPLENEISNSSNTLDDKDLNNQEKASVINAPPQPHEAPQSECQTLEDGKDKDEGDQTTDDLTAIKSEHVTEEAPSGPNCSTNDYNNDCSSDNCKQKAEKPIAAEQECTTVSKPYLSSQKIILYSVCLVALVSVIFGSFSVLASA